MQFFLPMDPPTATHQMKRVDTRGWKPRFYEPESVQDARAKFTAHLAPKAPAEPLIGPVRLTVKWLFPITGKRVDGQWKYTKPDTDNLLKLLKDVMSKCGFWLDDAQVASEINEKFWAETPGIFIAVEELE